MSRKKIIMRWTSPATARRHWQVSQYSLHVSSCGLVNGDQRRSTGSGSASEACSRQCAIQVHFKLASVTFKTLRIVLPDICVNFFTSIHYTPARNFRFSSQGLLSVSQTRTVLASHGSRLSAVSACNNLPAYIRNVSTISSFKHNLNTFLFIAAFAN